MQCSGNTPCSNCERKGKPCSYAAPTADKPIIILGSGGHASTLTFAVTTKHSKGTARLKTPLRPSPAMDDERFFYYFDVFAQRNNFNGKKHLFTKDVKQMSELQTSPYLLNSIRALGAFQASKLQASEQRGKYTGDAYSGYVFYSQAVAGLRQSLDGHQKTFSQSNRTALLWTTLFLGMFEVRTRLPETHEPECSRIILTYLVAHVRRE